MASTGNSSSAWEEIFRRHGRVFVEPHPDVVRLASELAVDRRCRVLDLGSGSGRHVVLLARCGFSVVGVDGAAAGVALTREWLNTEGLSAELHVGNLGDVLPLESGACDAAISVQTIHHATMSMIRATVAELHRVLKQGAQLLVTVPSQKNQAEAFREIEPGTFVPLDGPEKDLPHHFFSRDELTATFSGFSVSDVHLDSTAHYCMRAVRS